MKLYLCDFSLQMKFIVVLLITLQCIICSAIQYSAYHPVFEYDVPVASQPLAYTNPVQSGPYYGSYAVHTTPAVSHTYSQTQTHPIAYVKPVSIFLKYIFRITTNYIIIILKKIDIYLYRLQFMDQPLVNMDHQRQHLEWNIPD